MSVFVRSCSEHLEIESYDPSFHSSVQYCQIMQKIATQTLDIFTTCMYVCHPKKKFQRSYHVICTKVNFASRSF